MESKDVIAQAKQIVAKQQRGLEIAELEIMVCSLPRSPSADTAATSLQQDHSILKGAHVTHGRNCLGTAKRFHSFAKALHERILEEFKTKYADHDALLIWSQSNVQDPGPPLSDSLPIGSLIPAPWRMK